MARDELPRTSQWSLGVCESCTPECDWNFRNNIELEIKCLWDANSIKRQVGKRRFLILLPSSSPDTVVSFIPGWPQNYDVVKDNLSCLQVRLHVVLGNANPGFRHAWQLLYPLSSIP